MVLDDLIAAYLQLSSAIVSDALDRIGDHGTIEGVVAQVPGRKMCGPAYTVRYTLAGAAMNRFADFLDDVPRGAVVAIDNGGRTEMSVWGDTLSLFATRHDFAGTIIDGVCRDIDGTRALAYPMFSRGTFMRTARAASASKARKADWLGSVIVRPGDLIFADDTGGPESGWETCWKSRGKSSSGPALRRSGRACNHCRVWEAGAKAGADA
jgi:regulator of RNase E activity RraA